MLLELHFTENAFALELFLQSPKGLIDVVVANTYLHVVVTTFLDKVAMICRNVPYIKG